MKHRRVIIENVRPQIDSGRFPIKRVLGETVTVEADIFADGHDALSAVLLYRRAVKGSAWKEASLEAFGNDRWRGAFEVRHLGFYIYTVEAWIDPFKTWQRGLEKKVAAGIDVAVDLQIGGELIEAAAQRASGKDQKQLRELAQFLGTGPANADLQIQLALDTDLAQMLYLYPDKRHATRYERELSVTVERERARFSTWYELFPRSCGEAGRHGTFRDCEQQLPEIARMGFDVLYLPPIHPIGQTKRKGRNNSVEAEPGDCGSPWAIGSSEGGHKAIHPELGTMEDFRHLLDASRELGLEVALDLAFQCSPDHPYVREHPEWFRSRPDGSVQYAENPPKKYEDIYPFDFESEQAEALWQELKSVIEFWIRAGVQLFRVDNPHTKPFPFWEWVIAELRGSYPELIFLAEAFTRAKIMYRLGKLGYSQSYTYFAWRNTKRELIDYFTELNQTDIREYFRPNAWPNTPDILTEYLQTGGMPAFKIRLTLAATLCANYGIYGPAYEQGEDVPREPGSEEYLDSEKYAIKVRDPRAASEFREYIRRVNQIRHQHRALQQDHTLRFHAIDNDQLIAYSKTASDGSDPIVVVVNLDPHHTHAGWLDLRWEQLGLDPAQSYQVHDLLSEARYLWQGERNFVELNPYVLPAHIFRVRKKVRREQDFEYFL